MRGEVVEIAAACDVGLKAPRQILRMGIVEVAWRHGEVYLHVHHIADGTVFHDVHHLLEIRQIAPVVGHKARDLGLFADTIDAGAVFIVGRQWLLHIYRLASLHGHDGEGGVARRWCGNVYCVDVGVVYEFLRIGVPLVYSVALSISACVFFAAAHHGFDR